MYCPILLLTDADLAPSLRDHLFAENDDLTVACADSLAALEVCLDALGPRTRIISFLTEVLVPSRILARLDVEPINIHPGPPEIPGAHPEFFALWEGVHQFGVTAHVMTSEVDAGDILYCRRFDIPGDLARRDLGDMAFAEAVEAFRFIAEVCAHSAAPLKRAGVDWQGPRRRRCDLDQILANSEGFGREELARFERASGAVVAHCKAAV